MYKYIYNIQKILLFPVPQSRGFAQMFSVAELTAWPSGAPTPIAHGLCHAHPVDGSKFLVPAAWI